MHHDKLASTLLAELVVAASAVATTISFVISQVDVSLYDPLMKGGVLAALVGVLMWQQYKREQSNVVASQEREKNLNHRITSLEEKLNGSLTAIVDRQNESSRAMITSVKELENLIQQSLRGGK